MKRFFLLLILLLAAPPLQACTMAIHDWQLRFCLNLSPGFTVLPLGELEALHERIARGAIRHVLWMDNHGLPSLVSTPVMSLIGGSQERVSWTPILPGSSMIDLAARLASTSAILSSDQHSLKLALFSDKNALGRCHQLVLFETKRLRAIQPNSEIPWAQETVGQAWVSLIFYRYPVPGSILTLSAFPIHEEVKDLISNLPYIKALVSAKILKRRPGSEFTPASKHIPEIPQ